MTEIALSANVQSGEVLYPITIHLDSIDLPLRAVETECGRAYVTLMTGFERVTVMLGLITDT